MIDNYYKLKIKVRKLRERYEELTVEEKIDLVKLEMAIEGKSINPNLCHTKAEKKALKAKKAKIRKYNEKNKLKGKGC